MPGTPAATWRALDVRRVQDPAETEDLRIAGADVQRVVVLQRGRKRIESAGGGRWRSAEHGPGTVSLTAPGRETRLRWRATSPDPVVTLQVQLPGTTLRAVAGQLRPGAAVPELDLLRDDDDVTAALVGGLARARADGAPEMYAEAAAQYLAVHLLTRYGGLPGAGAPAREVRRTAAVRAHVREHLADPLTLAELAAVAGLSPWHFLRVFRAETGTTPMRFVAAARLQEAGHLLRTTSRSVTDIAYACGFSSPGHLTTAFTRHVGTTPTRFRAST
ncbi:helix-turn-helix domain-containing protein [Klenkia terrae]|uniref:AraC family transcriptional regulator n=1 Tax=Klenkia terrae TaxID=1052259 RepID=A0ABU8E2H9_9ACTN|nr:AraC family transcriptional regulator [Klenkia terrae]